MDTSIVDTQCCALLKSNLKQRCSRKRKAHSLFCGIHRRAKNVRRIFTRHETKHTSKIQSLWRGCLQRKKNANRGPGFLNRSVINNENDFMTFEDCAKIPPNEFFSYQDTDGFIYGFNIFSIRELFKTQKHPFNPYNRNPFPRQVINQVSSLMHNIDQSAQPASVEKHMATMELTNEQQIQLKCVEVFQRFDELELYTQVSWFLELSLNQLKQFHNTLKSLLFRRLSQSNYGQYLKSANGYLFHYPNTFIVNLIDKEFLQKYLLEIIGRLATEGQSSQNCITACYWVLHAFTYVSEPFRLQYPFLVQE